MKASTFKGLVYVVRAVPENHESLNAEVAHLLRTAEVVLHDEAVASEILDLIPASTQVRNVNKLGVETEHLQQKINSLLISAAREGHQVVRLIAAETTLVDHEMAGLAEAGVEVAFISGAPIAVGAGAGSASR